MKLRSTAVVFACIILFGTLSVGCSSDSKDSTGPSGTFTITGTWTFNQNNAGGSFWDNGTVTFTGTATSGTFSMTVAEGITHTGTYTVNGSSVNISGTYTVYSGTFSWTGTFSSSTAMSGSWTHTRPVDDALDASGTWTAEK